MGVGKSVMEGCKVLLTNLGLTAYEMYLRAFLDV